MEAFEPSNRQQHKRLRQTPVSYVLPMNGPGDLLTSVSKDSGSPQSIDHQSLPDIMPEKTLRVGVIGAGEVAQVIHLPTLQLLNQYFETAAICDSSRTAVEFCQSRFNIPRGSTDAYEIINDPSIDLIVILTSYEYHATYSIAALETGKHVMIEEPLSLSILSARRIINAEKTARNGARVFVSSMRRYAPGFVNTFKREIASVDRILYARCRDITGPKRHFVNQSGTPVAKSSTTTDVADSDGTSDSSQLLHELLQEAFLGQELTPQRIAFGRFLGSVGCHNLSLMRETLGLPDSIVGVTTNEPFYSAIFSYSDKNGNPYSVTFESGIDSVPRFDAHLTVYGQNKTVSIEYNTPYVKDVPIRVIVEEMNEHGESQKREVLSSYEDAYAAELKELYACLVHGQPIKTTAEDAIMDLKLFRMMFEQYDRQCGSVRTPLG